MVEVEVCSGLRFGSQVSGLLSFIKVYLSFLLDSKFDEVIIGRSLICSFAINYMDHPGPQLRASCFEGDGQLVVSLIHLECYLGPLKKGAKPYWLPYQVSQHIFLWNCYASGSSHRTLVVTHHCAGGDLSASSYSRQSGYCLPAYGSGRIKLPKIHSRDSYQFHSPMHPWSTWTSTYQ